MSLLSGNNFHIRPCVPMESALYRDIQTSGAWSHDRLYVPLLHGRMIAFRQVVVPHEKAGFPFRGTIEKTRSTGS
ncbi:hypothetical protein [Aquibium microcysteis]|uniref:hypothetical protein n=1 Tax=Aquibium microcysteis TaxID=675281 RepID=UPI00165CF56D|nr:hypothetical protein [Aquibium microcysteis]